MKLSSSKGRADGRRDTGDRQSTDTTRTIVTLETTAQQTELFMIDCLISDNLWDSLAVAYFGVAAFYPIRNRLQRLGQRYRNRPSEFPAALERLVHRYIKQKAKTDASFQHHFAGMQYWINLRAQRARMAPDTEKPGDEPTLRDSLEGLSRHQLSGLEGVISLLDQNFTGRPTIDGPKEFMRQIRKLSAVRPGPKIDVDSPTPKIRQILREARRHGEHMTDGQVATEAFSWYKECRDGTLKRKARENVRFVRRSRKFV